MISKTLTRQKTYKINEYGNRELIMEQVFNHNEQLVAYKNYSKESVAEGFNEYDEAGQLIRERDIEDGIESSCTEFFYNEEGDIIENKQYVAGELFEHATHEYFDEGMIKRTFRFDEEAERISEAIYDDRIERCFYTQGELNEKHIEVNDAEKRFLKIEMRNAFGGLMGIREEYHNEKGEPVYYEEKDEEGNIVLIQECQYDRDLLTKEVIKDVEGLSYEAAFEYDEKNNLISRKYQSLNPRLPWSEYQTNTYDEKDRLIREEGFSGGYVIEIYGQQPNNNRFIFEHEYSEIESN